MMKSRLSLSLLSKNRKDLSNYTYKNGLAISETIFVILNKGNKKFKNVFPVSFAEIIKLLE